MSTPERLEAARQDILRQIEARFPGQVIDEHAEQGERRPPDSELYPFWLAIAPQPIRVYVSRSALEHLADLEGDTEEPIRAWLDEHGLEDAIARRRDVLITSGGIGNVLDME